MAVVGSCVAVLGSCVAVLRFCVAVLGSFVGSFVAAERSLVVVRGLVGSPLPPLQGLRATPLQAVAASTVSAVCVRAMAQPMLHAD